MTAAGWYPDPEGVVRWWDGEQWTEHVQPSTLPPPPSGPPDRLDQPAPQTAPQTAPESRGRRTGLLVGLLVLALVVVAGLVAGVVLATRGDDDPGSSTAGPSTPASTAPTTAPTTEPTGSATEPSPGSSSEPAPEPTTSAPTSPAPVRPGPEGVADEFMAAVVAVDCPGAEALATADFLRRSGGCADEDIDPDVLAGATYEVREPAVDAGTADVDVVLTLSDDAGGTLPPFTFTLTLVETSRGWRVDDLAEQG